MGTWTISTTAAEDEAIRYAHEQSQRPIGPAAPAPPVETEAQFFQRMTAQGTIAPLVTRYHEVQNQELLTTLGTIPPENRDAAQTDIENVVKEHGGTVALRDAKYFWSANTAPPPRNQSLELDATEANFATVKKVTFHYLDGENINRMAELLALPISTVIRIEDAANAANFVQILTTATPIQRQGPDGYVEIAIQFRAKGGTFAGLDTHMMAVSYT